MDQTVYLICAAVGGTLLACQILFSMLGHGEHHEAGGGHDAGDHDTHGDSDQGQHSWFVGVLTFRSVVAALTFFGLFGLTSSANFQHEPFMTLGIALAGGLGALFAVAYMMQMLHRLKANGTVHIERAVGQNGTVYLTIPGLKTGAGKVTLRLQNRTVEYQAITPSQELATGSKVVVTAVIGPDTVEVVPANQPASIP